MPGQGTASTLKFKPSLAGRDTPGYAQLTGGKHLAHDPPNLDWVVPAYREGLALRAQQKKRRDGVGARENRGRADEAQATPGAVDLLFHRKRPFSRGGRVRLRRLALQQNGAEGGLPGQQEFRLPISGWGSVTGG